jgi:hypothetical protein
MCIAILNKTSLLPIETIKHSFNNNPDGAGLCAIIGGKIVIHKELNSKNYKSFYAKYVELRTKTQLPVLLHFRIGTSGIKDERNIHPFLINSKLALIHNGMISYNVINKDFSDTWHFTQLLKSLKNPARLLNSKSLEYQMLSAFTKGSKIALLHVSGYGYTNYAKTDDIKDIKPEYVTKFVTPLSFNEFSGLTYNRRQVRCIQLAKTVLGSTDIIFNVRSYTTVLNSLFAMYRSTTLYDLYLALYADAIAINDATNKVAIYEAD